jgi:hypothetical protein
LAGAGRLSEDQARKALAAIRLVNGSLALFAPQLLGRRLGADPERAPGLTYALRMFGVRTIVVAGELVSRDPAIRRAAGRAAVVIHASDVYAAVSAGVRGEMPRTRAAGAALISTVNTCLAVMAWPRRNEPWRGA